MRKGYPYSNFKNSIAFFSLQVYNEIIEVLLCKWLTSTFVTYYIKKATTTLPRRVAFLMLFFIIGFLDTDYRHNCTNNCNYNTNYTNGYF